MKRSYKGILINEALLSQTPIRYVLQEQGCSGLGMFVITLLYLKGSYHCIGRFSDLTMIARRAHKQPSKCVQWITDSHIFAITDDHQLFTYTPYRTIFGLTPEITQLEAEIVNRYGNYITRTPEPYADLNPGSAAPRDEHENKQSAVKDAAKDEPAHSEESITFKNDDAQFTDQQQDAATVDNTMGKTNGIGIHPTGKNNPIPKQQKNDAVAGFAFIFFEQKIELEKKWRSAVSESYGVDLSDETVMHHFARWMYLYCISRNKRPITPDEIKTFACNLLLKGRLTRRMFDEYLRKALAHSTDDAPSQTECAPLEPLSQGTFETIIDGQRYALGGEPLPDYAPPQTDINWRWSYRHDCYEDKNQYDEEAEKTCYEEQQKIRNQKKAASIRAGVEAFNRQLDEERSRAQSAQVPEGVHTIGEIIKNKYLTGRTTTNKNNKK